MICNYVSVMVISTEVIILYTSTLWYHVIVCSCGLPVGFSAFIFNHLQLQKLTSRKLSTAKSLFTSSQNGIWYFMAYTKCTVYFQIYWAVKNSIMQLKHNMEMPVRINIKKEVQCAARSLPASFLGGETWAALMTKKTWLLSITDA